MAVPEVTVCVPVKDRRERMLRCLDALLALDHPAYEVLVLDNDSSDGTAQACRERAASASVPVRVEVVAGSVGRIRNEGARLARGAVVAYTDSDCRPEPGWLAAGAAPFADPRVGVVTGRTLPEVPGPYRDWPATIEVTGPTGRYESCNLLVRREAFVETAGFDEAVGHFWEDTPAGWSLVLAGWRAAYAHGALVRHDVTYPGFAWHLRRGLRYGNAAAAIRRHPELRRELLWHGLFAREENAPALAALAGLLAARRSRAALLLALPYLRLRLPRRRADVVTAGQHVALDAVVLAGMLAGSARWRRLVL